MSAIRWLLLLSVIMNVGLWIFVFLTFSREDPASVLHYRVNVGIDFIGPGHRTLLLPAIGTALLIINTGLAWIVRRTNQLMGWLFIGVLPLLQSLLLASYIILWIVNT